MTFIRRSILVMVATWTTGCTVSKNVKLSENPDPARRPAKIEVMSKGAGYTVHWPVVQGDSLHGWADQSQTRRLSFALSDVESASVREVSGGLTAAAVVLGFFAAVGAWVVAFVTADPP